MRISQVRTLLFPCGHNRTVDRLIWKKLRIPKVINRIYVLTEQFPKLLSRCNLIKFIWDNIAQHAIVLEQRHCLFRKQKILVILLICALILVFIECKLCISRQEVHILRLDIRRIPKNHIELFTVVDVTPVKGRHVNQFLDRHRHIIKICPLNQCIACLQIRR